MKSQNWIQVQPGIVAYIGPDFDATLYKSDQYHPDGELARRPSQLPSAKGWCCIGDLPRSPIRGIRNFKTLEEGKHALEETFNRYRTTMSETGMTTAEIKAGLEANRKAEDAKYLDQVQRELNAQGNRRRAPGRTTNLALKVGS